MNANTIISDSMTLEEKLAAIDAAIKGTAEEFNRKNGRPSDAPVDPASLTICDGCE
jgi:hypothetical protein